MPRSISGERRVYQPAPRVRNRNVRSEGEPLAFARWGVVLGLFVTIVAAFSGQA
ncbi:MAG: hypothetical protein WCL20_07125 [Actinomycetes bacterium]